MTGYADIASLLIAAGSNIDAQDKVMRRGHVLSWDKLWFCTVNTKNIT